MSRRLPCTCESLHGAKHELEVQCLNVKVLKAGHYGSYNSVLHGNCRSVCEWNGIRSQDAFIYE